VRLPGAPGLRSGLIGTAELTGLATAAAPLAIPATALFAARTEEGFVYVYEPGTSRVRARMVRLGEVTDGGVTIVSGLQPGERIVRTGLDRLRDGARVRIAG
jgi:multidrug efflux pump subunit AcrA (membrane-fusion protein)